ncbi:MAG: carboxypeptidase-like regulatory domain-containing protein, partial [Bacteroidia bacterium]|nr:carboxypeptidase-like regulatory domain-containing protein [Bacteroidia bacterium]
MSNQKLHFIAILCIAVLSFTSKAQTITGKITNDKKEPVPYATIYVSETHEGTISNQEGNFHLNLSRGKYHLTIRSLGFYQIEKEVELVSDSLFLNIILQHQEFEIKEVKVFPGKEDPAWFIIRKAIANAARFREKIEHYEADLYIKSNFTVTNLPKIYKINMEMDGEKMEEMLRENVTYVIESQNKITFDYPNNYKQEVISKKSSLVGLEEPPVMELMTSNFYEERPNNVISPLSAQALKHYNYRYEGFITAGNSDIFKIKVIPKRKSDELVSGYIYIVDRIWCIYNVDFNARMEFIPYRINQE